jgi:UDP-N-acetylmuramoyl-tripeptide--D-alanyl-D-alanine ligase
MLVTQAINAMGGVVASHVEKDVKIRSFLIDSRQVRRGGCFVAFKGENTDGNLYAQKALDKGAALVVVEDKNVFDSLSGNKVLVRGSMDALKALGAYKLSKYKGRKIAITGSVGKTTTKELISAVLSSRKRVYTAYGNYNNELGVAICAANLKMNTSYAVFELGTNSKGEISPLSQYIRPDICVLTGVGHAHIGRFNGIDQLAEEKLSIIDGMENGTLWVHSSCRKFIGEKQIAKADVKYFGKDMTSHIILADSNRTQNGDFYFTAVTRNTPYCFKLNHIYSHFVENSLAAIGIGMSAKLSYTDVMKGVRMFQPKDGRGRIREINNLRVIDDTYNAGFESVMSAIDNLAEISAESKFAVIGEMGEIEGYEEMLYFKLVKRAKELKDVNFIFVGKGFPKADSSENISFLSREEAMERVADIKEGAVLFKASRAQRFEEFVNRLEKEKIRSAV